MARLGAEGAASRSICAFRPLEDHDLHRGAAPRPDQRAVTHRRPHQWRTLHASCREGVGAHSVKGRTRRSRQPRQSQGQAGPQRHPRQGSASALPAALQSRPQSHRAGLRQTQTPDASRQSRATSRLRGERSANSSISSPPKSAPKSDGMVSPGRSRAMRVHKGR
jgi:hypothetical protein